MYEADREVCLFVYSDFFVSASFFLQGRQPWKRSRPSISALMLGRNAQRRMKKVNTP